MTLKPWKGLTGRISHWKRFRKNQKSIFFWLLEWNSEIPERSPMCVMKDWFIIYVTQGYFQLIKKRDAHKQEIDTGIGTQHDKKCKRHVKQHIKQKRYTKMSNTFEYNSLKQIINRHPMAHLHKYNTSRLTAQHKNTINTCLSAAAGHNS